ncbi:hypothetical protein [Aeromonas popoffii]
MRDEHKTKTCLDCIGSHEASLSVIGRLPPGDIFSVLAEGER